MSDGVENPAQVIDKRSLMNIFDTVVETNVKLRKENEELREQLDKEARGAAFEGALQVLRMHTHDPRSAKNYVQMNFHWDKAIAPSLPFKNVAVIFMRDGGKHPAQLVNEAITSRNDAIAIAHYLAEMLAETLPIDDEDRLARINDRLLALKRLSKQPESNPLAYLGE